jgi:hypothetical protein
MSPGGVIPPGAPVGGAMYEVTCTCGWHDVLAFSPSECDRAYDLPDKVHTLTIEQESTPPRTTNA